MRFLHIETGRHLYGGALQVSYLLRGLREKGVENILVCTQGSEIERDAASYADVRAMPMRGELDILFGWNLLGIIQKTAPALVHVHSRRGADIWGTIASQLAGTPCVITRRVDNPEPAWIARAKYGRVRKVVTISEGIRQVLLSQGVPAEKLVCVHSAVDPEPFNRVCERKWLRAEFGLTPENKIVAMIAQMIPRKGHRFIIEAAPRVLGQIPETRFLLFGQGPLKNALMDLCREKGVADAIRFPGFRKDLPQILPGIDLIVHPALMEGLGVSLLQASAAGVPIVASRAGGIPEVVRHQVNGFLVDPEDIDGLAGRITELLVNHDLARAYGAAGRKLVRENFSIKAMTDGNMAVYRNVIGCSTLDA